jgi:hypothetical protein
MSIQLIILPTSPALIQECIHSIASTASFFNLFLRSVIVSLHLFVMIIRMKRYYPMNTVSGSTDIARMEKISNAICANNGYTIEFPFHHLMRSNFLFSSLLSFTNGKFKYSPNSSLSIISGPKQYVFMFIISTIDRFVDCWDI